ncbi:phytoene/squalene synthase family protein [uncultured Sphingomonas sp.]|uniref:phytoene/squalene synthase family protein n=1 Tax=uncultured Sphingomonas sp. TaxID=158754 RepID=UPI0025F8B735|nr:phytoene/squalene synthase family protein [uncultured Sphingomonas sp.]
MIDSRAELVAYARDTIARGSKSFAAASKLFDPVTRERAWLLYAWCRACDDMADGQELGHGMKRVDDVQDRLLLMRMWSAQALAGKPTGNPAFDALGAVAADVALPASLIDDVLDGFQLDADGWQPVTEQDLYQYCYHVAGAVGGLMAVVMGVPAQDTDTLDRACDLGLAFQLANIARDVGEDAGVGRCYLPRDWLHEQGIDPADPMATPDRISVLTRRMAARAALHEDSARVGAARLPWRSAWAVLAAADIYGGIARKVAAAGPAAWDKRQTTSKGEKIAAIARAFVAARWRPVPDTPRDPVLWTRAA